jgi:ribosome-binding ATPase YchF (GTP1/OBG family)
MDDQTTTDSPVEDSGAQGALPEQQETTAVADVTDQSATSESQEGEQDSLPQVDEKLENFAKGIGIEDTSELSEREIKLLKVAKDNQAEYQRTRQKASELEKNMQSVADEEETQYEQSTGQPLSDTDRLVRKLYIKDNLRSFFDANPNAREYEAKMAQIVTEKPHLAGDLDSLYAVARANDAESLKSQGGREALESLAGKQRATAPTGSATNSMAGKAKITRSEINSRLQSGDTKWYSENLAEINKMVAEGTLQ